MKRIRLGVNIDHVATVRNARGESYPSPLRAAILAEKNGADSVTIHLREDRRHINEFDLKEIRDLKGRQLSGGQRRKVEIARTLVSNPKMILLDEPFAGIDPIAIEEIKKVLNTLKNKGIGILITDHNVRETLEICNHAAIINNGEIIAHDTKESLISNQVVKEVYLGNMYN